MSKIIPPSCDELIDALDHYVDDEPIVKVWSEADPSWRHGCYMQDVFHRISDDTYWAAEYRLSTDCETNELRDGGARIYQVEPVEVTKTEYHRVEYDA